MERLPLTGDGLGNAGVRRLSLVRLSGEIARSLSGLGKVAVEGEVVRPKHHPGGIFFTLRDRAAQLSVRCPGARASRCRVVAGERVLVTATVGWVPDRGHAHLVAEEVAPVGEGAIAAAVAERRSRLHAEGLLDRPRRPIPRLPATVGVICGSEAAVRADFESVVAARFPGYPVEYVATNVSGPGAADAVIEALVALNARPEVEVIVLARGGGDAAQLLPFSDEALCRAMCEVATPVVSAIGHEGDRPLCDEVADLRCGTPSLAAGAVVPSRADLEAELARLLAEARVVTEQRAAVAHARLGAVDRHRALKRGLEVASARLRHAADRRRLVHPARAVSAASARLDRLDWRGPARRRIGGERDRLESCRRHLDALSPARVLQRGYAVVRGPDGAVLRRADQAGPGDALDIELAAGHLAARVEQRQGPE